MKSNSKSTYRKEISNFWHVFCNKTSIHGLKYIGDTKLTNLEKTYWIISFTTAVIFFSCFVYQIYNKYEQNPIIMSVNPKSMTIFDIPFPAIKICNMNLIRRTFAENIIKNKLYARQTLLRYLCDSKVDTNEIRDVNAVFNEELTLDMLKAFYENASQTLPEMFVQCSWTSVPKQCDKLFVEENTDEGLCYTFNSQSHKYLYRQENVDHFSTVNMTDNGDYVEWNPENGYSKHQKSETLNYLRKPTGAGLFHSLHLILNANLSDYYCSSTSSAGFKMLIYAPSDNGQVDTAAHLIPAGTETQVIVAPVIYDFEENLKNIEFSKRDCYFRNERRLKYFKFYSLSNCKLECQSNYTIDHCGCIPFPLPRYADQELCSAIQLECAQEAFEILEEVESDPSQARCLCSSDCAQIEYSINFSYGSLKTDPINELNKNGSSKYSIDNYASIRIFLKNSHIDRYTKRIVYSFPDFLSSIGGLLGLFLGLSWLSVIEIFYYLIKLLLNCYKLKRLKRQIELKKTKLIKNKF